ncbi:unnamed protein product [Darwinula stevensoni]|uniref:Spondin domain-containing protein n=1 Tax=Darwinula stevensoni TaxID=69355 RepID=A0A7R9A2R7_9CRUS|nr:unnamed protein product [Darwinula stevensoni]CAG0890259.1 unnamed protein product [Darwinula stevensoni]
MLMTVPLLALFPVLLRAAPDACDQDKLLLYQVNLETNWSREAFPKHYPEWRPPAQWSKVVGRAHCEEYEMFRLNRIASEALRQFAEGGRSELFEEEDSQGNGGILDAFVGPAIQRGVGVSQAEFFVDASHSRVSLVSRIVPSPDWFVGVDSLRLCVSGKWADIITVELHPLDAGTDRGFTFTSPNWPQEPQVPIERLTSNFPDHPASSFYYEDKETLPPIAVLRITKLREYRAESPLEMELRSPDLEVVNVDIGEHDITYETLRESRLNASHFTVPQSRRQDLLLDDSADEDEGNSSSVPSQILDDYETFKKETVSSHQSGDKRKRRRRSRHCIVSAWSEWSSCSHKCGFGESTRERVVVQHSKKGGKPCPPLKETRWCSSSAECTDSHHYFDWEPPNP